MNVTQSGTNRTMAERLHPLRERAEDERGRDHGEGHLERHEGEFRNGHADREGAGRGFRVTPFRKAWRSRR